MTLETHTQSNKRDKATKTDTTLQWLIKYFLIFYRFERKEALKFLYLTLSTWHLTLSFPSTVFPGGIRDMEPPDPIPNSEVKRVIADDSVGVPMRK